MRLLRSLRWLVRHPAFRRRPVRTILRGIAWEAAKRLDRPLLARLPWGPRLWCFPQRYRGVDGMIYVLREYESETAFVREFVREGMHVLDVGANIEPKPHHLAQYGVMGEVYARKILGIEKPRVAIMNVGGEEQKGTAEMKHARELLKADDSMEFIGNIEGRGVFDGEADVVVTDGVVGNVMLKLAEGLSAGIFKAIGREVARIDPELAMRFKPVVAEIYRQHDYHEYGAAPLLGVDGLCFISHGSSEARAIANAIHRARVYIDERINEHIVERLATVEEAVA